MKPIALLTLLLASIAAAGSAPQPAPPIARLQIPLKFPAVGNIEAVKQWRFARLQDVEFVTGTEDIVVRLRVMDGNVIRVIAPRGPLVDLAWHSGWFSHEAKDRPTRRDYVERMIAFDVDATGRLIAMMSLETVRRDTNRLRRAIQ